jgi:retron-type reverse transcriptase
VARKRCWEFDWVVDLDIKASFDSLDHDLVEQAVAHFPACPFERYALSGTLSNLDARRIAGASSS